METAQRVSEGISILMEHYRAKAAKLYGVDLAKLDDDPEEFKRVKVRNFVEASSFLYMANLYKVRGNTIGS